MAETRTDLDFMTAILARKHRGRHLCDCKFNFVIVRFVRIAYTPLWASSSSVDPSDPIPSMTSLRNPMKEACPLGIPPCGCNVTSRSEIISIEELTIL